MVSKKSEDKGVIVSGKYNPLSGANLVLALPERKLLERYGLNCSISL
jgi:hypothetical protein